MTKLTDQLLTYITKAKKSLTRFSETKNQKDVDHSLYYILKIEKVFSNELIPIINNIPKNKTSMFNN